MRRLFPLLALLSGCSKEADTEEQAAELQTRYLDAICTIYSEPTCVDNMADSCPISITFDSLSECLSFFALFAGGCDIDGVFAQDLESATACVEQLESWDCASEPVCEEDGSFAIEEGACASVTAAFQAECGGTTGTTTTTTF